jgi:hypothetical protein
MVAVPATHHTYPVLSSTPNGFFHRSSAHYLPHPIVTIHQDRSALLAHDSHRWPAIDQPLPQSPHVNRNPHDSVGLNAPQVRADESIPHELCVLFGKTFVQEDVPYPCF